MGQMSMTNKSTSKNRPFMTRQRERSTGKEEQGKQCNLFKAILRPENLPRNKKGMADGRTMVSSRNGKIPNNIMASSTCSSISSLIAKNATMAGDKTKVDSETQVRYPDKELLSQVKIWVMTDCKRSQAL